MLITLIIKTIQYLRIAFIQKKNLLSFNVNYLNILYFKCKFISAPRVVCRMLHDACWENRKKIIRNA